MFEQIITIARNTFTESIRQPIFVVLVLLGALALVLNTMLAAYTMDNDNKLLVDMGLSTVFFVGLLLAAFTATGVLASEIEQRTVLTVVSKPVARPTFVMGKYLGVAGAIAIAFYTLSIIFLFTRRHGVMQTASDQFDGPVLTFGIVAALIALIVATFGNYLYRWVFSSTLILSLAIAETIAALLVLVVGKGWVFQSPLHEFVDHNGEMLQIVVGLVMVFEAVLILTAVAVAASTRLGQIMTLVLCMGIFFIGLISNSFSQLVNDKLSIPRGTNIFASVAAVFTAETSVPMKMFYALAKVLYLALPNLQFLWPADAITQEHPLTAVHIATVSVYALLYIGVVLCVAVTLFQTREVG